MYNVNNVKENYKSFNFAVIKETAKGVFAYIGGYFNPWLAACACDDCGDGIMVEPKDICVVNN